jgi:hypothetical protein
MDIVALPAAATPAAATKKKRVHHRKVEATGTCGFLRKFFKFVMNTVFEKIWSLDHAECLIVVKAPMVSGGKCDFVYEGRGSSPEMTRVVQEVVQLIENRESGADDALDQEEAGGSVVLFKKPLVEDYTTVPTQFSVRQQLATQLVRKVFADDNKGVVINGKTIDERSQMYKIVKDNEELVPMWKYTKADGTSELLIEPFDYDTVGQRSAKIIVTLGKRAYDIDMKKYIALHGDAEMAEKAHVASVVQGAAKDLASLSSSTMAQKLAEALRSLAQMELTNFEEGGAEMAKGAAAKMKEVTMMLNEGVKSKYAEIARQADTMGAQLMSVEMAEDEDAARHDMEARAQAEATDAADRLQAAKAAREAAEEAAKVVPIEEQCDNFLACTHKNHHRGHCITGKLRNEERTGYLDEVSDCVVDPYNKAVIIPAQLKIILDTVKGAEGEIYKKKETEMMQIKDFAKVMREAFDKVGCIVAKEDEAVYAEWYEKRGEIVWGEIARNFIVEFTRGAETVKPVEVQAPKKKKKTNKKAPGAKAALAKGPKKPLSDAEKVAVKEMREMKGRAKNAALKKQQRLALGGFVQC